MSLKKGSKIIIALLVSLLLATTAFALETRASERFSLYSATVSAKSNGDLAIRITVQTTYVMDYIGADHIDVQRYDGSDWVTEYTLTTQNTLDLQVSNSRRYFKTHTYSPDCTGATYRVVLCAYAEDQSGISTANHVSNQIKV